MIQPVFNAMITVMMAKFMLNDVPHAILGTGAPGMSVITYEITPKGRLLTRFETEWWRETLNEPQRLIMLTLYIAGKPLESKFIASEVGEGVLQVEADLRQLGGWYYVERKFGGK